MQNAFQILLLFLSGTTLSVAQFPIDPSDSGAGGFPQPAGASTPVCGNYTNAIDLTVKLPPRSQNCLEMTGGFTGFSGSFAGLAYTSKNLLHLGEEIRIGAEDSVRRRATYLRIERPSLLGKSFDIGGLVYGQRFQYDQNRESSLLAFDRNLSEFDSFDPENLQRYVSYNYGASGWLRYRFHKSFSAGVAYSYDVADVRLLTSSTGNYSAFLSPQYLSNTGAIPALHFDGFDHLSTPTEMKGIHTSKLTPSFTFSGLDDLVRPTRGAALRINLGIAGLGGNVNLVEPSVEARYFHRGFNPHHVLAIRLRGQMLRGYGDHDPPAFDRYSMGGEDELRGFNSWSITPFGYIPEVGFVDLLNPDGTTRLVAGVNSSGQRILVPEIIAVQTYQLASLGGDTKSIANLEYRIPLHSSWSLTLFDDTGFDRVSFRDQLHLDSGSIFSLNNQLGHTAFGDLPLVETRTMAIRMSTGAEVSFLPKKLQIPIRFYAAYNPLVNHSPLQAPLLVDRSYFPNLATFNAAAAAFNTPTPAREPRFLFRFAIGRTF